MGLIRGWLFDNLGLKLVALLLAVLVYLNVYTDRPTTMLMAFPLQFTDLPDSLSLLGPAPSTVQAELRGTGKQLIRLRLTEPPLKLSLAGVNTGRYERALSAEELPLPAGAGIEVDRLIGPRTIGLELDRKTSRWIPVAARVEGTPPGGMSWGGTVFVRPSIMRITGPAKALAALDSVRLTPARLEGRRDTVRVQAGPVSLPDWCTADPATVTVTVPLKHSQP